MTEARPVISSMTGFARAAGTTGAVQWVWEVRSVNGRGLDIRLRVPSSLDAAGESARTALQAVCTRGQAQVSLNLTRPDASPRVRINEPLLAELAAAAGRVPRPAGIGPVSLDALLGIRGVIEADDEGRGDEAALIADLTEAAKRLASDLAEARRAEGRHLQEIVSGQIAAMSELVEAADACPARKPEAVRARLTAAVAALAESRSLDPERLHQEAILLAAKADIREELDRLRAHLAAARELLDKGGAIGRRLDFLAQELGRESNTLCSKANDIALSRIGLDLKAVVEQFREQVQNVE